MHHLRHFAGFALLGSLFALATGCGKEEPRLEVHPVKGVVLYNGEPMKGGGSINFFPLEKGGRDASGTIAEDGTFTLQSYRDGGAGAAAGKYRVVVNQVTVEEGAGSSTGEEVASGSVETVEKKYQIPAIYNDQVRTPLDNVEIKPGENDLKIELVTNPNANRGA